MYIIIKIGCASARRKGWPSCVFVVLWEKYNLYYITSQPHWFFRHDTMRRFWVLLLTLQYLIFKKSSLTSCLKKKKKKTLWHPPSQLLGTNKMTRDEFNRFFILKWSNWNNLKFFMEKIKLIIILILIYNLVFLFSLI